MTEKKGKINFSSIEHLSDKEKKALTSNSNLQGAKEGIKKLSRAYKSTIDPNDPEAMLKTTSATVSERDATQAIDALVEQNRNLKNACRTYKGELKGNKKRTRLVATLAVVGALLVGAKAGAAITEYNNQNQQFVIENTNYENPYNYGDLYNKTNDFLKSALLEKYLQDHPDEKDRLEGAEVDSFMEASEHNTFDVNITEDPHVINRRETYTYSVKVDDNPELLEVYRAFRDMRIISNSVPKEDQNTVDYMIDVNNATINLLDALKDYKNNDNKNLEKKAQDVIKDSRSYYDDDGER